MAGGWGGGATWGSRQPHSHPTRTHPTRSASELAGWQAEPQQPRPKAATARKVEFRNTTTSSTTTRPTGLVLPPTPPPPLLHAAPLPRSPCPNGAAARRQPQPIPAPRRRSAMAQPASSQCCRAFQRPILPSRDAVWITDSLLASAFERYCYVSRTWSRKASNVPGPLESQRRLGKRRMGDAGALRCPPTPPAWAFPVPLDLSQWTWEPPSLFKSPAQSRLRQHNTSGSELADLLSQWLRSSMPQDYDEPPVALAQANSLSAAAAAAAAAVADAAEAPRDQPSFATHMDTFRWAATHATLDVLTACTEDLSRKFQQLIFLGEVSPEDVFTISAEVFGALDSRFQGSPGGRHLAVSFCKAILAGSTTSRVFSPSLLDARLWDILVTQIAKLPVGDELCDLLVDVMTAMPTACRDRISGRILPVLDGFLSAWSCSRDGPSVAEITQLLDEQMLGKPDKPSALSGTLRQAKAFSEALREVGPKYPVGFLDAANRLVLSHATASTTGRRAMRYNWLCVLARMPRVNQDILFDAAAALSNPSLEMAPLTGLELCSLLLTQWASRGYLNSPQSIYQAYKSRCRGRDEIALASLFVAISRQGRREIQTGLYTSSWRLLTKLGRIDDVFWSLRRYAASSTLPVHVLQDLAYTSDNHNVAIRLRDLWTRWLKPPRGPDWNPGVFEKYAERIVLDPLIPPKVIWRVLDINRMEGRQTTLLEKTSRHRGDFGQRRAAIVEKVSNAFVKAPHLPDRVAFRHVSQSYHFIKAVCGNVPYDVIWNIYRVAVRDLLRREPGRTKRLLWFVSVVQEHFGIEVAWSCRLVLRRWRSRLKQICLGWGRNW